MTDDEPIEKPPPLYWNPRLGCYECLGCQEIIEPRRFAELMVEGVMARVQIEGHPENTLLWVEMWTLEHSACHKFKDLAKAKDYREHRRRVLARSRRQGGRNGRSLLRTA